MSTHNGWLGHAGAWAGHAVNAVAGARLSILIFHRVLPSPDLLFPQEMDAARFDRLMALVARGFNVFTLGQALASMATGHLPPRALVVTFDDGYADNAEIALPILSRHGLVATFFVSTGFLDGGRMWNDTVIECLRRTSHQRVDLAEFGLGPFELDSVARRRAAIDALLPRLKYLPLVEREQALARLSQLTGPTKLPADLMMRSPQLVELHRAGMEIGGHTVHHPILTELSDADAETEIGQGRQVLQSLIDAPVDVFAYPNGGPGRDYNARHVAMVRNLGFRGAVSTAIGVAGAGADPFQLPRFTPWDAAPHRWLARLLLQRVRNVPFDLAPAAA